MLGEDAGHVLEDLGPDTGVRVFTGENEGKGIFALADNVAKHADALKTFDAANQAAWDAQKATMHPCEAPGLPPDVEPFDWANKRGVPYRETSDSDDDIFKQFERDTTPPVRNLIQFNHIRGT